MQRLQPDNHSSLLKEIDICFEHDQPICIKEMDISLKDNSIKAPSLKKMKKHYFSLSKNAIVKNSKSLFKELRAFRPFNKEVVDFLLPSVEEKIIKRRESNFAKSLFGWVFFVCLLFGAKFILSIPLLFFIIYLSSIVYVYFLSAIYITKAYAFHAHLKTLKRY